jgi:3-methyladenine DNA glycosylase AlkD
MNGIIASLKEELVANASLKVRESGERFFREPVKMYGIRSQEVVRIGKDHYKKVADKSKAEIFSICDSLWQSGIIEESFIACNWSYNLRKSYEPDDFKIFEAWVKNYVSNWASCDTLCNHSVGTLIDMYPELLPQLKEWTKSENRWVRRAAAVTLIVPARQGRFLKEIFEIADLLHSDGDDMVQKGYGWMLKAASQAHLEKVFAYIISRKSTMPRTSLRYAIEKMPQELKAKAMIR